MSRATVAYISAAVEIVVAQDPQFSPRGTWETMLERRYSTDGDALSCLRILFVRPGFDQIA